MSPAAVQINTSEPVAYLSLIPLSGPGPSSHSETWLPTSLFSTILDPSRRDAETPLLLRSPGLDETRIPSCHLPSGRTAPLPPRLPRAGPAGLATTPSCDEGTTFWLTNVFSNASHVEVGVTGSVFTDGE